ncbi:MAG TPA: hypothetical protein VKB17_10065 [Thermoleophilaceae bacterium]|nr:hypothetical protein [Thermoleophilaceae bacterium]
MEPVELRLACSLTPAEQSHRTDEFRELARSALASRRREEGRVVLSFRAEPGVADQVEELARRERKCCPFLELRVEPGDGLVTLSIGAAPDAQRVLDAFYELAS